MPPPSLLLALPALTHPALVAHAGKPVWIAPVLLAAVIDGQGEVLQLLHGKAGREGAYRSSHGQGPGGQRKGAEVATAHTVRLLATLPALRKAMHEHCAAVTPSLPLYQPQHDSADTSRSAGSRAAARTTVLRLDGHAVTTIAMQYGHTTAVLVVRKEWQGVRITLPASAAGVQAVASTLPALHAAVAALQPSLGHIADLAKVK